MKAIPLRKQAPQGGAVRPNQAYVEMIQGRGDRTFRNLLGGNGREGGNSGKRGKGRG